MLIWRFALWVLCMEVLCQGKVARESTSCSFLMMWIVARAMGSASGLRAYYPAGIDLSWCWMGRPKVSACGYYWGSLGMIRPNGYVWRHVSYIVWGRVDISISLVGPTTWASIVRALLTKAVHTRDSTSSKVLMKVLVPRTEASLPLSKKKSWGNPSLLIFASIKKRKIWC